MVESLPLNRIKERAALGGQLGAAQGHQIRPAVNQAVLDALFWKVSSQGIQGKALYPPKRRAALGGEDGPGAPQFDPRSPWCLSAPLSGNLTSPGIRGKGI